MTHPIEVYTFDAPAHYASALINGDLTGLDYYGAECVAEFEAWRDANPEFAREVSSCDGEPWDGQFRGKLTEMLTYKALRNARSAD